MLKSDIQKYSVAIEYNEFNGTGVLVKATNNYYLLTAKHNFKKKPRDTYHTIIVNDINLNSIKTDTKVILKEIVYDYEDLIIFLVEGEFIDFEIIEILQGTPTDKMDYYFYGYPTFKPKGHFFDALRSRTEKSKYSFTLRDVDHNHTRYIEGASGSGVFTKNENDVYFLCGIVLKSIDKYSDIEIFNLSNIIDEVNVKLEEKNLTPIEIKETNVHLKDIDGMYSWITSYHSDNFLVQKTKEVFGEEHNYKDLIEPSKRLENLNNYMSSSNQFSRLSDEYTQKIADMYLLGAFIASRYYEKERALEYFNIARFFRPQYILFLAEIDKENSKKELFQAGKIAYSENNYNHSYNCFKKVLSLKLDNDEQVMVYEYLIKITKIQENNNEIKEYYFSLLELYEDDLQKAIVYYELSLIETKERSNYCANEGLKFVRFSDNLEIKYLLYKRLYELTENEEIYKLLKANLEELVKTKIEYKYELSTLRYSETLDKIGWASYLLIISIFFLSIVGGTLLGLLGESHLFGSLSLSIFLFSISMLFIYKVEKELFYINIFVGFFSGIFLIGELL